MDVLCALAHLFRRIIQGHNAGAFLQIAAFRNDEGLLVLVVYPGGNVAAQLNMLLLIVTHRNDVRIIQQNVGSHQHRIGEQTSRCRLFILAFILELGHSGQLAGIGLAGQHPSQFCVTRNIRLHENDGFLWIDSYRQIQGSHIQNMLPQGFRILRHGDGMLVHDTVNAFMIILQLYELLQCTQIISQVNVSCRLYAGKNSFHTLFSFLRYWPATRSIDSFLS